MCADKYTFLFSAIDGEGHVNACIGIAEQLRNRGHSVIFALPKHWGGKLAAKGFGEELFEIADEGIQNSHGGAQWGEMLASCAQALEMSSFEIHEKFQIGLYKKVITQIKYSNKKLLEILAKVKPDAIVIDNTLHLPALMDQGIPWIQSLSINPIGVSSQNVPPAFSGYAVNGDQSKWKLLEDEIQRVYKNLFEDFKIWILKNGGPELKFNFPFFHKNSPYANIYMYPMELDYTAQRPNPPNWHQFDAFVRQSKEEFKIPQHIASGQGKLIYFSLGTIGCMELEIMKRLIGILSKSPNRFIVSKGPKGDDLDLGSNMCGWNSVPQTKVIELVDLVITHGGNNTITESFYYGKKVLVLPLLWDQLDNATRIEETGHGLQFHPYKVTEKELLDGIELLLGDDLLERRMTSISKRIQASNSQSRAADLIENIARNNRVGTCSSK